MAYKWDPDWTVHPGSFVEEFMEENKLSLRAMAISCGRMPPELLQGVIDGEVPVDENIAKGLQIGTAIPVSMWLRLEEMFRAGLKAGKTWTK